MIDASNATPELFAALANAQAEVENATKNAANPHFRSRYADLAEVLNTVRPVFTRHGLSIIQSTGFDGDFVSVETLIAHAGGGRITSTASCHPAKTDAQGIGSATTYLRRYALAAMTGVAQEDDDGNAAAHDRRPARQPQGAPDEATLTMIATLEAAAAQGTRALGIAFAAIPTSPAKARIWTQHQARLKALAAEVDTIASTQPAPQNPHNTTSKNGSEK